MSTTTMATTTLGNILTAGVAGLQGGFITMLPLILPVAAVLAIFFGVLHWLFGASHRK